MADSDSKRMQKLRIVKSYLIFLAVLEVAFGFSSFWLGWGIFTQLNRVAVCTPPPFGLCLSAGLPFSVFVFWIFDEIAISILIGFTVYKIIAVSTKRSLRVPRFDHKEEGLPKN